MQVESQITSRQDREQVLALLCDPYRFGPLLPNFDGMDVDDERHFTVKMALQLGQAVSTILLQMELHAEEAPERVAYRGTATVMSSPLTFDAKFSVTGGRNGFAVPDNDPQTFSASTENGSDALSETTDLPFQWPPMAPLDTAPAILSTEEFQQSLSAEAVPEVPSPQAATSEQEPASGCEIACTAEIRFGGMLSFMSGMLDPMAKEGLEDFIERLRRALDGV